MSKTTKADSTTALIRITKEYEVLLAQGLKDCRLMIKAARSVRRYSSPEEASNILDGKTFDCERHLENLKRAMVDLSENAHDLANY